LTPGSSSPCRFRKIGTSIAPFDGAKAPTHDRSTALTLQGSWYYVIAGVAIVLTGLSLPDRDGGGPGSPGAKAGDCVIAYTLQ
jgi:hypothetical protein